MIGRGIGRKLGGGYAGLSHLPFKDTEDEMPLRGLLLGKGVLLFVTIDRYGALVAPAGKGEIDPAVAQVGGQRNLINTGKKFVRGLPTCVCGRVSKQPGGMLTPF